MQPLLNFIAEDTLKAFSPINLFISVVRANGAIFIPFAFGHNSHIPGEAPETFLDEHTPAFDAYRNGKIVEGGSVREYPFYVPGNVPLLFPDGFESSWVFPVPNYGAIHMFCSARLPRNESVENFLWSVGEIVSISFTAGDHGVNFEVDLNDPEPLVLLPLTPRQWAIKDAMLRGLTNGAIAREMNFSESLIRHETIRIYSKLGINGRKELLSLEVENREA
ncbi:MAG: response regulator transcription factor [Actinobacteria bacterium]|nr:response regulator transcription factor [Actinomycetota bacterium]